MLLFFSVFPFLSAPCNTNSGGNVSINSPQEEKSKTNRSDSEFDLVFVEKKKKKQEKSRGPVKSMASKIT